MAINDTESQDLLGDRPEQRPGYGTTDSLVQEPREPARYMMVLGVFLVVLAGFAFTAANVIQKIICPELNFWSLFLIRSLTQIPIMAAWTFWTQTPWLGPREIRCKIFMQGSFGGLLLLAIFVAVKHVPLGNASAIFFCTPVFTFLFAICTLGEYLKLFRGLVMTLLLTGVVVITRPSFFGFTPDKDMSEGSLTATTTMGYIAAWLVPVLSAFVSIWTRQCRNVNAQLLMFWFGCGSLFWAIIGGTAFGNIKYSFNLTSEEAAYTMAIVFLGILGNLCYTFAVKWVSPTTANVFRSMEVILNYVLQIVIEHMEFHPSAILGIICLILAVILMAREKQITKWHRCL